MPERLPQDETDAGSRESGLVPLVRLLARQAAREAVEPRKHDGESHADPELDATARGSDV